MSPAYVAGKQLILPGNPQQHRRGTIGFAETGALACAKAGFHRALFACGIRVGAINRAPTGGGVCFWACTKNSPSPSARVARTEGEGRVGGAPHCSGNAAWMFCANAIVARALRTQRAPPHPDPLPLSVADATAGARGGNERAPTRGAPTYVVVYFVGVSHGCRQKKPAMECVVCRYVVGANDYSPLQTLALA